MTELIDVTKCLWCRKGISSFMMDDDKLCHFDFFHTAEEGAILECLNPEQVKPFLKKLDNGLYSANEELQKQMEFQDYWWQDITILAYEIFKEQKLVTDFFNDGEKDNRTWNLSNSKIESKLLVLASEKGISTTKEDYPDLIINQP